MSKRAPPLAEISLLKSKTIGKYRHDLLITKLRVGKTIATSLDLGGYLWRQTFIVILMAEYDIILGKPWHSDNQPQKQFKKNLIKLQDKHTTRHITVRCLSSKDDRQEEFLSY